MKRIISMLLSVFMLVGLLSGTVYAAPKDKITADDTFMSIFKPGSAATLDYEPGQKAAVAIPSNAHYADYASEGFWFIWGGDKDLGTLVSAKQKDTGFAVLADFFFDKYESLTITVKSSNEYRDVTFTAPGTYFIDQFLLKNEKKGADGGYHNINWIGVSMVEKTEEPPADPSGTISIEKWVDGKSIMNWATTGFKGDIFELLESMTFKLYPVNEQGGDIDYDGTFYLGTLELTGVIAFPEVDAGWYAIVEELTGEAADIFEQVGPMYVQVFEGETEYKPGETVSIVSGTEHGTVVSHDGTGVDHVLPDVWNGQLAGQPAFEKMKELGAEWIWDVEDTYEYGVTGDVFKTGFSIEVDEDVTAPFYFAADNAAVVYVNGFIAGYTEVALNKSLTIGDPYDHEVFGFLEHKNFDGRWSEGWTHAYEIDIDLAEGNNDIIIVAANSVKTENTGTPNDTYDITNNPCGLIFACAYTTEGTVFENKTTEIMTPSTTVSFNKTVLGKDGSRFADVEEFEFKLYKYDEESKDYSLCDGTYTIEDFSGTVVLEKLEEGKYFVRETPVDGYVPLDDLYFEVVVEDSEAKAVWDDFEDAVPTVVNVALGALEVAANVTAQHDEITYEPMYEDLWKENNTNTLVSKSNHNLGTLNGHQVFVAVNIQDAMYTDGVNFEVADSSPNNIGIGYYYNVKIENGQINVTFDDVKKADVGIMAASDMIRLKNGHPNGNNGSAQGDLTRENNTLSVALPDGCDDYVYLFVHIAEGIQWYTGEKKIVGYEEVGRVTVPDTYTDALTVTLKDEEDNVVGSKPVDNNGSVTFENLASGVYTCILSGDGFDEKEQTITVVAGKTANVTFTVLVTYPDVEIGKDLEIGTIIPKVITFSAPVANTYNFVLSSYAFEEALSSDVFTVTDEAVEEEAVEEEVEATEPDEEELDEDDLDEEELDEGELEVEEDLETEGPEAE